MHVRNLYVGGYASNCYLVTDDTDTYSVVIDPSVPPPTRSDGRPAGTHLVAILLTHTHYDHMLALEAWRALGAPVTMYPLRFVANRRYFDSRIGSWMTEIRLRSAPHV